jgi:hypothetical protein
MLHVFIAQRLAQLRPEQILFSANFFQHKAIGVKGVRCSNLLGLIIDKLLPG